MSVKNKQNSSVNFIVRAKFRIWGIRNTDKQYKHPKSIGDA